MISTITFEHGNKTCAVSIEKRCTFQIARKFGTEPVCALFRYADIKEVDGWLQRCPECIKQFGEEK